MFDSLRGRYAQLETKLRQDARARWITVGILVLATLVSFAGRILAIAWCDLALTPWIYIGALGAVVAVVLAIVSAVRGNLSQTLLYSAATWAIAIYVFATVDGPVIACLVHSDRVKVESRMAQYNEAHANALSDKLNNAALAFEGKGGQPEFLARTMFFNRYSNLNAMRRATVADKGCALFQDQARRFDVRADPYLATQFSRSDGICAAQAHHVDDAIDDYSTVFRDLDGSPNPWNGARIAFNDGFPDVATALLRSLRSDAALPAEHRQHPVAVSQYQALLRAYRLNPQKGTVHGRSLSSLRAQGSDSQPYPKVKRNPLVGPWSLLRESLTGPQFGTGNPLGRIQMLSLTVQRP